MSSQTIKKLRSKRKLNYDFPVLLVSRSNNNISAQVLAPVTKKTITTVSSVSEDKLSKSDKSKFVGKKIAQILQSKKISKVIFDRNGYLYHGRIEKLVAEVRLNNIEI